MQLVETVAAAREVRAALPGPLGLVPTMGYLHAGHISLVEAARRENDAVAATIFVNPSQFGPSEDFARYPRDLARDLAALEAAGCDLVFAPPAAEMYPPGYATWVDVERVTDRLEGASRPGHFRGVATVVAKLFGVLRPDRAYFGQKDAQQCVVIRRLVEDLNLGIELRLMPTVREADGLALSSRNVYLGAEDRQAALVLSRSLFAARDRFQAGERDAELLRSLIRAAFAAEPRAGLEYVSVADARDLAELDSVDVPAIVSLAARVGKTRLIDNVTLVP
jgi:pantoate--beta-alanine ligase